ncbi:MAG: adenylate kinase [candidate division Zixibacteria bacterium]|nr:adenylate kinase [candidate division Zixibacteria bacterium]
MNLIFLGAPGSGKGTQAIRLAEKVNILHLSTGDLLRAAVKEGTELGKKAEGFMKAGELVPDEVIIGLIEAKQASGDLNNGFILDGFPRTIPQAESLDKMFDRVGTKIDNAVLLDVDDEEIINRLSGRMSCSGCQAGYNYPANMPKKEGVCDKCGGELVRRPDDMPDVVKNRLDVYKKQTQPIEDYYRGKGVLLPITGVGVPDEIFSRICEGLKV